MTSSFKAPTEDTPPLSSAESTEARARPSGQSADTTSKDGSIQPMTTTQVLSKPISNADNSERLLLQADLLRTTVRLLEKRGLIRRFKVLSKDGVTKEIRLVLSPQVWTEDLRLTTVFAGSS